MKEYERQLMTAVEKFKILYAQDKYAYIHHISIKVNEFNDITITSGTPDGKTEYEYTIHQHPVSPFKFELYSPAYFDTADYQELHFETADDMINFIKCSAVLKGGRYAIDKMTPTLPYDYIVWIDEQEPQWLVVGFAYGLQGDELPDFKKTINEMYGDVI